MDTFNLIWPTNFVIKILKIFGLWYFDQKWMPFYRLYAFILHFFFLVFYIVSTLVDSILCQSLLQDNSLYFSIILTSTCIKIMNLVYHNQEIIQLLAVISESDGIFYPKTPNESAVLKRALQQFDTARKWYFRLTACLILLIFAVPLFAAERSLPFSAWVPINWKNSSISFLAVYFYQMVGVSIEGTVNSSNDILQAFLVFQTANYYELLALRLKNVGSDEADELDENQTFDELVQCYQLYEKLNSIRSTVENLFSVPYFIHFASSGIMLCMASVQLTEIDAVREPVLALRCIIYLFGALVQNLLSCFTGNMILSNSDALTTAAYNMNWLKMTPKCRKLVVIFMEMTQKPHRVSAGKLFTLNLNTFTSVLNAAYSYYAVVRKGGA